MVLLILLSVRRVFRRAFCSRSEMMVKVSVTSLLWASCLRILLAQAWKVPTKEKAGRGNCSNSWRRVRIAVAALLVKVTARICLWVDSPFCRI